jgi:circadian clock protein KaiC
VTLSETEDELRAVARSHGWALEGNITIRELVPPEESLQPAEQYTMFHPAEVELSRPRAPSSWTSSASSPRA